MKQFTILIVAFVVAFAATCVLQGCAAKTATGEVKFGDGGSVICDETSCSLVTPSQRLYFREPQLEK